MATIKELGQIDFTAEQLKALAIEADVVNHGTLTPEAYLVEQVLGRVDEYVARHITAVQDERLIAKVKQDRADAATKLGVDIDITPPSPVK